MGWAQPHIKVYECTKLTWAEHSHTLPYNWPSAVYHHPNCNTVKNLSTKVHAPKFWVHDIFKVAIWELQSKICEPQQHSCLQCLCLLVSLEHFKPLCYAILFRNQKSTPSASHFSILLFTTTNKKDEKTVIISILVNTNWWFTVLLYPALNSRKVKLYVVVKRETLCEVMYWNISLLTCKEWSNFYHASL